MPKAMRPESGDAARRFTLGDMPKLEVESVSNVTLQHKIRLLDVVQRGAFRLHRMT